ncbi:MAG: glycoside hydrolase family 43 protein, partial [Erysipelotrichaceae bacterium]
MIQNPVLKGFNPDPSICRVGSDYYIATSTFEWFPGVQIHHSTDLENWTLIKRPLERLSQLNMLGNDDSCGIWAPCLTHADDKFWLVYTDVKTTVGTYKDSPNYIVTCDTIDGEWSAPIYVNSSGFDPSLFHDEDGSKYFVNMIWDHRVPAEGSGKPRFYGIVLQEIDFEQGGLIGEPKVIYEGTAIGLTEGPHIYKKDGYYYLAVAEGGTVYEHAESIVRSIDIWGEYESHPDNPMITAYLSPSNYLQKTGHGDLVETEDGDWYFAHLCGRPLDENNSLYGGSRGSCPLGRETSIQKVEWIDGWPYIV